MISDLCNSSPKLWYSLHAKTLPATFPKVDNILVEVSVIFAVSDPAFGMEFGWLWEKLWVHENEVATFADWCLQFHQ